MQAQENYSSYINKLFFNVYSNNPDSIIKKFLSDFVPVVLQIADPPQKPFTWSAYSNKNMNVPPAEITHSFIFYKHRLIAAPFKKGEFKVITYIFNYESDLDSSGIKDIQVVLEFEKLYEASKIFEEIKNNLIPLGQMKIENDEKDLKFFELYSDDIPYAVPCRIRLLLLTEMGLETSYKLYIYSN